METIMRSLILLISLSFSLTSLAQNNEHWFQYNDANQSYNINANNVHPAAFFKYLSLKSGIEIKFDKQMINPINYYANNAKQSHIIRFLEKEFSTLLTYKKSVEKKQDVLTGITILPKGHFQSDQMVLAVDPLEEATHIKDGSMPSSAQPVYLTRMQHLEQRVRENLEQQAERIVIKREKRLKRLSENKREKEQKRQELLAELAELRNTDPKLYAAQKSIYFPEYSNQELTNNP